MLLTIICVLLIILGIKLIVECEELASILFFAGCIGTLICVLLIMRAQIPKQAHYEKAVMQRDMLEYRLEHRESEQIGNELLYSDVLEFNQDLYSVKKWSKNPWVNWFWNNKIAELDYIDIDKENTEREQERS